MLIVDNWWLIIFDQMWNNDFLVISMHGKWFYKKLKCVSFTVENWTIQSNLYNAKCFGDTLKFDKNLNIQ